jgi:hypothetical protein
MPVDPPYFKTSVHSSMPELIMCQTIMNLKPPRFLFQQNNCICCYPELRWNMSENTFRSCKNVNIMSENTFRS